MATQGGAVMEMFTMTSSITSAEAYTMQEEILDVKLVTNDLQESTDFALYQNEPNPWTGSTMIRFDLPESGPVKLTLFDANGKVLKSLEKSYDAGTHSISLNKKDLSAHGVIYYRLDSGNYSATKKMVRIE